MQVGGREDYYYVLPLQSIAIKAQFVYLAIILASLRENFYPHSQSTMQTHT